MITAKEIFSTMNSGGTKIPAGFHENVKFTGITPGATFFDIGFEKDGKVHNKRVYAPSGPVKTREGEDELAAIKRDRNNRLQHLLKMMRIFMGQDAIDQFEAPDYNSFVERGADMLNRLKDSKTVNLKLIYDKERRYSSFGFFPDYVEEHVLGETHTLKYSKYELEKELNKPAGTASTTLADSKPKDLMV